MPALAYRPSLPRPDDPTIIETVASAVERGHPIETAGRLAGLGKTVAWDWLRKGEEQLELTPPGTPWEELGSHAKFASRVKDAEARFVDANLRFVNDARSPDAKGWLPAMTLLERRRPQDFGRKDRMDVQQTSVSVSVSLQAQLSPSDLASVLALAQQETQRLLPPPTDV